MPNDTPIETDPGAQADFPDSESGAWTAYTPSTASDATTTAASSSERDTSQGSSPHPGSSYLIQCTQNDQVITLQKGEIVLAPVGGPDRTRWECIEVNGWLGFREPSSNRFLGYNHSEELWCKVEHHQVWERFQVREASEGKFYLLMVHYENWIHLMIGSELWPLGDGSNNKLRLYKDWAHAFTWRFLEVTDR